MPHDTRTHSRIAIRDHLIYGGLAFPETSSFPKHADCLPGLTSLRAVWRVWLYLLDACLTRRSRQKVNNPAATIIAAPIITLVRNSSAKIVSPMLDAKTSWR